MSASRVITDWITVSGNNNTLVQNEAAWLDTEEFQDGGFVLQVSGYSGSGTVTIDVQSAPIRDETVFGATGSGGVPAVVRWTYDSTNNSLGVQELKISRFETTTNQPISKATRFVVRFPNTATTITLRILGTFNQTGH